MALVVFFNFRVFLLQSPVLKEPKVVKVLYFVQSFCFGLQYSSISCSIVIP